MIKPFETVDGNRYETIGQAIKHAAKLLKGSVNTPEYIWRNRRDGDLTQQPVYVLHPDGIGHWL